MHTRDGGQASLDGKEDIAWTGFSPWTVQLGVTHYNDYAIQLPVNPLWSANSFMI